MKPRISPTVALCGSALLGGFVASALPNLVPPLHAQPAGPTPLADVDLLSARFEAVARKLSPSVVSIEAVKTRGRSTEESGSGVIVAVPGQRGTFVLTNNHVIAGSGPEQITVSLADQRVYRPDMVWADPETDVAVLRLNVESLPAATLGDSDRLRVGQWVLAVGSPFGLSQSVTHGIISARERGQVRLGSAIRIKEFLQTDAPINPGSSGGPLADLNGEVIAINTAIASPSGSNAGVGFSIPINLVQRVVKQLLERGTVSRGYLGLKMGNGLEPADALRLGLDRVQGAVVEEVFPESPAARCGLQPGDVILQLGPTEVKNENHLINLISNLAAGQRVTLKIWRDRQAVQAEALVADWAESGRGR